MIRLSELLFENEYRGKTRAKDIAVSGIVRDLAEITPGCLFVCIRGGRFDTHAELPFIASSGAAGVIVEIGSGFCRVPGLPIFEVPDSRRALAFAWSRFTGSPGDGLTLIGVTGTNGKTSTAWLLRGILADQGLRCAMIGTIGYLDDHGKKSFGAYHKKGARAMTTPDPEVLYPLLAEMVRRGITHLVMEVSSHALVQRKVDPLSFRAALFTNLSHEHLDFHGSMQAYCDAKKELFQKTNCAVLNSESPFAKEIAESIAFPPFYCGGRSADDLICDRVNIHSDGVSSFRMRYKEETVQIELPLPGRFMVQNAALAAAAASALGIPLAETKRSLEKAKAVPGRLERISPRDADIAIYIDYAHTEEALRALLRSVREFAGAQRVTVLFGCGGKRDKKKRPLMGRAAEELADHIFLTSDNTRNEPPQEILLDILSGMSLPQKRTVIEKRKEAIEHAILNADPGDILLLVGKGHEGYEIGALGMRPFHEKRIAEKALLQRKKKLCGGKG